mgnify:CR=1 FL=1
MLEQLARSSAPEQTFDSLLAIAIILDMTMVARIDGFGRVVLPKGLLSLLGLGQGTPLKIELIGDKIQLSVADAPRSAIQKKTGASRVFRGPACAMG